MTKKHIVLFSIVTLAVVFLSGCTFGKDKSSVAPVEDNSPLIFFYGEECPHCKNVEKFFEENKVAEKIQFSQREVYHNEANSALLLEKAEACKIAADGVGVPFLWNNGECIVGDESIINFFRDRINNN